jgi:ADP-ribose pyrophosphatase
MCAKHLEPWEIITSRQVFAAEPWIRVFRQEVRLPDGTVVSDYHHIQLSDYVVIFAQTEEGKVVAERQYKHGLGRVSVALPAGQINDGEQPIEAAARELLEETGFQASNWKSLGVFAVHGNYGCGRTYIVMGSQARRVAEPNSGDLEDMEILLMEPSDLVRSIKSGEIGFLGTVAAVTLAQLVLDGRA